MKEAIAVLALLATGVSGTSRVMAAEDRRIGQGGYQSLSGFHTPLRDPFICRAPDGTYYLTGTTRINTLEPRHADFQNNDGVRLWKSKDLKNWEEIGTVWDVAKAGWNERWSTGPRALSGVADSPEGPWSEWRPGVRHGGHGGVFRGLDGHGYGVAWDDVIPGWPGCKPGLVRLKTELRDGQVLIDVDEDWTPADYQAVERQRRGEGEPR